MKPAVLAPLATRRPVVLDHTVILELSGPAHPATYTTPMAMLTGKFRFDWLAGWASSTGPGAANAPFIVFREGGSPTDQDALKVTFSAGTTNIVVIDASGSRLSQTVTFSAGQRIQIEVDCNLTQLKISGATTGNGTFTGTGEPWFLDVGANIRIGGPFGSHASHTNIGGYFYDILQVPMASDIFPLEVGPTDKYLVDQNGVPTPVLGDTGWSLMAAVNLADAEVYLSDRQDKGFNTVLCNVIEHFFADDPPANAAAEEPFAGAAFSTAPNEDYFKFVDSVVHAAAVRGIQLLLSPVYVGFNEGEQGWADEIVAASAQNMEDYGAYIGRRYKHFNNIIWVVGGDADNSAPVKSKLLNFVDGLIAEDTRHLITAHNAPESQAIDEWSGETWLTLNTIYTYSTTSYNEASDAYDRTPAIPYIMFEARYENEPLGTPISLQALCAQAYFALLTGACGNLMGNCPVWRYAAIGSFCSPTDWEAELDSAGSLAMQRMHYLWRRRPWHLFAPDYTGVMMTAGAGSGATFSTTGLASDGSCSISYLPTSREVTMDLDLITGTNCRVWWVNVTTGLATDMGTFATTGSQNFTPPSAGQWLLVIDDDSQGFEAPSATVGSGILIDLTGGGNDPPRTVANANIPAEMRTAPWQFSWTAPSNSSATTLFIQWATWSTDDNAAIYWDRAASQIKIANTSGTNVMVSGTVTWTTGDILTFTLDPIGMTLDIAGADAGNGSSAISGTLAAFWPTSADMRIGDGYGASLATGGTFTDIIAA